MSFCTIGALVCVKRCPLASDVSPSLLTDPLPNLPTSSASTIFSTCTDSNWDLHFQLPEFSSAIVHKLQTGSPPLKEAERSAMLKPSTMQSKYILNNFRIAENWILLNRDLIHDGFTKYADAIAATVKNKKSRPNLVDKAIGDIFKYKDESTRHEATKYAAVIAVPTLVNEKLENMLSVVDETHEVKLPVIMEMFEGEEEVSSYTVKVDGFKVTESSNFMSAFAIYLATFYIFNLVYPTALKKTLNFHQRMILNIQDGLPVDNTVMRVV
ncbi:hypothetical protein BSL78_14112 [Apostichopus japonicus]|uniref:Uncharacterized protein n=1 Tax=Stichopus japonicus TaxID=307972 RepID=A0A2G8KLX2_STIJA|nr:hypothetical protein BSL78_14112 [Apostichopus japonicus]